MLLLQDSLINKEIISIHAGNTIALTVSPLINPNNLQIFAIYVNNKLTNKLEILLTKDIREFSLKGIIINHYSDLSEAADLVKFQDLINLNFFLINKPVVTISGQKLGKVNDFAFDNLSYKIQKLYISKSILKSLNNMNLSIDRNQITEVTDRKIIVKDLEATNPLPSSVFSLT